MSNDFWANMDVKMVDLADAILKRDVRATAKFSATIFGLTILKEVIRCSPPMGREKMVYSIVELFLKETLQKLAEIPEEVKSSLEGEKEEGEPQ